MKEWLCLTCQVQKALTASESVEPSLMKSQVSPNKVSTPAAAANQKKDIMTTQKVEVLDKNQRDSPTPGAPQKKEETKPPIQMDITQTSATTSPHKKEIPAPTKEEEIVSKPNKEVPTSTAAPSREKTAVASALNKPPPAQAPPDKIDIETSFQKKKDFTQPITNIYRCNWPATTRCAQHW